MSPSPGLLRYVVPTILALSLAACGGSGTDEVPAATVQRDVRVLSAAGGTLTVDAAALTLPADALAVDTEVTLEQLPVDAVAGELLHLRLSPAGQRLDAAAELRIDLPAAPPGTQAFWDVGGDLVLAAATRNGDRFTLALPSLGFDGGGRRLSAAAAGPARRHALAAASPAGGDLKLKVQDCQAKARALTRRLASLLLRDAMDEAQLLSDALVDLVQQCQALEVQQAQAEACTQQASAAATLQQSAPPTLADLDKRVRDLLGATDAVRKVTATCAAPPDVNALLRASIEQYTRVLKADLDAGRLEGPAGARELSRLFAVDADCQLLGLAEACTVLRTEVFPAVLDGMRADAFAECRERGSSLPVSQLIDLGVFTGREGKFIDFARYTTAALELDAAMCTGPELQVRVFASNDALDDRPDLDTRVVALGALGQYAQQGEVRPPRAGRIVLSGPVKVSRCPDGTALGAELVVRITSDDHTGTELARRPHNGTRFTLDTAPIDLSVPQILAAAGLDPANAANVSLTLTQEGGACASLLDENKQVLNVPVRVFQLDLLMARGTHWRGTIELSDVIDAGDQASLGFVEVQGGDGSTFCDADVCLTVQRLQRVSAHSITLAVETVDELSPGRRTALRVLSRSGGGFAEASPFGASSRTQRLSNICERVEHVREEAFARFTGSDGALSLAQDADGRLRLVMDEARYRFSGPRSARATRFTQIPGNGGECPDRLPEFVEVDTLSDTLAITLDLPGQTHVLPAPTDSTTVIAGNNLVDGVVPLLPPAEASDICNRSRVAMPFATLDTFFPLANATEGATSRCDVSRFVSWRLEKQ